MTSKLTPVVAQVRQYAPGKSYDNRDPYQCIATIQYLSENEVYISGTIGKLNFREMVNLLYAEGISTIHYERHGKMVKHELNSNNMGD